MNKIIWMTDDSNIEVKQEITDEVAICSINFEDDVITFHRPVNIDILRQIYYHYEEMDNEINRKKVYRKYTRKGANNE